MRLSKLITRDLNDSFFVEKCNFGAFPNPMAYIDIHDYLLVTQDEYLVDLEPKFYDGDLAIGVDIDAEDSSADGGLANEVKFVVDSLDDIE